MPRHTAKSIRPKHAAIVRAPGLLPMRYTVREICEELDVPLSTLKDWRTLGMPCERDAQGHIWIHGTTFAAWLANARTRRKHHLRAHEAYCVTCRAPVALLQATRCESKGMARLTGWCPQCGRKVTRVIGRIQPWSTATTTNSPAAT